MKNIPKIIGNWASFFVKNIYNVMFSKIKEQITDVLRASPVESVKIFYGLCAILFFVSIASSGLVLLLVGLIISAVQLTAPHVDKIALAGKLIAYLGAGALSVSFLIIGIIGSVIYIKVKYLSEKLSSKINK
jgi:hypothetical protein